MLRCLFLATGPTALTFGVARSQTAVKIGVLNDRSGVYSDLSGEASVVAARMAV